MHTRVLFIGNSFTFYYDIPYLLESMARYAGRQLHADTATIGGEYLEHASDPDTDFGKLVLSKLSDGTRYDRIILQEQSSRPVIDKPAFFDSLARLLPVLRTHQPDAEILLYQTWGYGDGYRWDVLPVPLDHESMTCALRNSYREAGVRFGLPVIPVGDAVSRAYRESDVSPFGPDEKHTSYAGSLLSAMTHYFTLFPDASPDELPERHVTNLNKYLSLRDIAYACARCVPEA